MDSTIARIQHKSILCCHMHRNVIFYNARLLNQPMETVLRKTRGSTGVNCRNVGRRLGVGVATGLTQ